LPLPSDSAPRPRAAAGWQQLWREAIRDPRELLALLGLESAALNVSDARRAQFPLRVPRGFVAKMRHGDPGDPLLRQVLRSTTKCSRRPGFSLDAVGDGAAKAADGVIRKYRGRALLVTTGSCAVHCRYCFRRHFDYASETAAAGNWRQAVELIRADPDIEESHPVRWRPLVPGHGQAGRTHRCAGPGTAPPRLRIHTRLPVVLPERVDAPLLAWLRGLPWPVTVVLHANHG
jgi:L-lysine 2,3-aminomutase